MFSRKYVQIQTGCDGFCTYCATVLARGKHQSKSKEEIIAEIDAFAKQGGQEAVLTGVNL